MGRIANTLKHIRRRQREHRRTFVLYSVLRTLVIVAAVRQTMQGNYEATMTCVLSLLLFLVPAMMEEHFEIEIPPLFEGIIYLFIFAAEILGEVNHFYVQIPGWDTMLHTMNGFLAAAIGFSLINLLNRHSDKITLTPIYLTLVAFCFSMTVGVLWEFFECAMDQFFGMDMQKDFIVQKFASVTLDPSHTQQVIPVTDITSTTIHTANGDITIEGGYLDIGILDTMKDLFVNFIGAVVFCTFGYVYLKDRGHAPRKRDAVASGMMVRVAERSVENEDNTEDKGEVESLGLE